MFFVQNSVPCCPAVFKRFQYIVATYLFSVLLRPGTDHSFPMSFDVTGKPIMTLRSLRLVFSVAILLAMTTSLPGQNQNPPTVDPPAQQEGAEEQTQPQDIQQDEPTFFVGLKVNHETHSYRQGDHVSVRMSSEEDGYAYVLYAQADGTIFQIFPNSLDSDNRIEAKQTVQIPDPGHLFRWRVGPPYGEELVKVIVSKEPIEALSHPSLRTKTFNHVSPKVLKGVALELGEEKPPAWGEAEVSIRTYPRGEDATAPESRRHGVFFGVSQHRYHFESEQAGSGLNLKICHRDASQFAHVMKEVGELSNVRTFTNSTATRDNLEDSITRWLPSVARPGDTVIIYFSGHGGQLDDQAEHPDEADGTDEFLVTHDFLPVEAIAPLLKRLKEKDLTSDIVEQLNRNDLLKRLVELLTKAESSADLAKVQQILVRETGVSDDLFGHWLQSLDGRQVVVILDTCFSGGFAAVEKGFDTPMKRIKFDFLDGEISRLKDIGQSNQILLTSSRYTQLSQERFFNHELSMMTQFLVEAVRTAPAHLTIQQAYQYCEQGMQKLFTSERFQRANEQREANKRRAIVPHQPTLTPEDSVARDALLKP